MSMLFTAQETWSSPLTNLTLKSESDTSDETTHKKERKFRWVGNDRQNYEADRQADRQTDR
jgi:hypothetical protein